MDVITFVNHIRSIKYNKPVIKKEEKIEKNDKNDKNDKKDKNDKNDLYENLKVRLIDFPHFVLVTSKGITAGEADISGYINKRIYTNQVQLPDADFYNSINILAQQQIYKDANLDAYSVNDPIAVKSRLLKEIEIEKNKLLYEINSLKKG